MDIFQTMQPQFIQPGAWGNVSNSELSRFYERYLRQKAISVFEFENLPENWDRHYFTYSLFTYGYIGVLRVPEFGTICQKGVKGGFNIYYQPSYILYASPFYRSRKLRIGVETEAIKLQPDWGGVLDLTTTYADMMAICTEGIGINMINSKLAYVFATDKAALAESFKQMYSKISRGEPAVAVGKKLFTEDGKPAWDVFANNLRSNYIASDMLADLRTIEHMFDAQVGIPNANTDKRERLISDEVNSNRVETMCKAALWLETIRDCLSRVNKMFGLDIRVKYRFDPTRQEVMPDAAN